MRTYYEIKGNPFLRGIARLVDFRGDLSSYSEAIRSLTQDKSWTEVGYDIEQAILKYEQNSESPSR